MGGEEGEETAVGMLKKCANKCVYLYMCVILYILYVIYYR